MKLPSRRFIVVASSCALLILVGVAGTAVNRLSRGALTAAVGRQVAKIGIGGPSVAGPPAAVTIQIDPTRVLRPIKPEIYGVSAAGADDVVALGAGLNRWGGNPNTRYNWAQGYAWNAARDWEFRNYGTPPGTDTAASQSSAADRFVAANLGVGVPSELTVPAIGWVARDGNNESRSLNVPTAGGPPLDTLSEAITGYDPAQNRARTSVRSLPRKGSPFVDSPDPAAPAVYQDEWVHHLVDRFGPAAEGGVRYYAIDNEPDLWAYTHTDVHPVQPSYDDLLATFVDYADAIKDVDPSAQILGPVLSGWTGYFYSPRDQGSDKYHTHADRAAHGDMPFLPWWLEQVRKHDEQIGRRTLDAVDIHYYPQAAGVFGAADDPQTRGLRLRSTRSLWDPTYVDESWIAEPVQLIPRLRQWIAQYYPGTQLAIGEWNWGGEQSMSGALAAADVLGIFGRDGVDMASYWTFPPLSSPVAQAFSMYTHYDAQGDAFGDQAIQAEVNASADFVTSYASLNSATGDIVVVALNKQDNAVLPATIHLTGRPSATGALYRLDTGDATIQDVGPVAPASDGNLHVDLPALSITLMRIAPAS